MSDRQQPWPIAKFGEVFDFKGGSQPPKAEFVFEPREGYIRLLQIRDFEDDSKAVFIKDQKKWPKCSEQDIMIGRYGASVGRVLGGKAGAYNVALVRLLFEPHAVDARWARYFCASGYFQDPLKNISRSAQNGFNKEDLADIEFPFPPLDDQRRMVAKLDRLFEHSKSAREELNRIPRLVERYKQAVLTAAFRGDLTTKWRASRAKQREDWNILSISEIADVGTGATPKRGNPRFYENGTVPWVTSSAVNEEAVTSAEERITEAALRETNCRVYPPGTLLVAMYGEGQTRGKVSVLKIHAATNQALAAIQLRESERVSPQFVFWFLRASYIELRRQAAGGVQPNLNVGMIKRTKVCLPPLEEQREIVHQIETLLKRVDFLSKESSIPLKLLNRLDKIVLARAFRGELL